MLSVQRTESFLFNSTCPCTTGLDPELYFEWKGFVGRGLCLKMMKTFECLFISNVETFLLTKL